MVTKEQEKAEDTFDDRTITEVKEYPKYFEVATGSWVFAVDKKYKIVPHVGEVARTYGVASVIDGLEIGGKEVYYKTKEDRALERVETLARMKLKGVREFRKARKKLNRQYERLPVEFRQRIDKFRATNPDFRWEFEAYEMSVCVDAVRIYKKLKTEVDINAFWDLPYAEQQKKVPHLFKGHSGNSFGMACRLALRYAQNPQSVTVEHGALTPLVGCVDYGCPHPDDPAYAAKVQARALLKDQ